MAEVDKKRYNIALFVIALFPLMVVFAAVLAYVGMLEPIRDIIGNALNALLTIIGMVIAFYFGNHTQSTG